jgi:hypothetical protein
MTTQEKAQEEFAWAQHYDAKAAREQDPHMKKEWIAQAERAREEAARLQAEVEA